MNIKMYKEKAVVVKAYLKDFEPVFKNREKLQSWKNAFYELMRYQLTYGFAYDIQIYERRKNGVYVYMVVKNAYIDHVTGLLTDLGYANVQVEEYDVGILDGYDIPDDVYSLYIDF